jgi:hypothetical protein
MLVWPLGSIDIKRGGRKKAGTTTPLPDLTLGHQLPRFSSNLVLEHLANGDARRKLGTEVLWVALRDSEGDFALREFVYSYAWTQSEHQRREVARQEKVADLLGSHSNVNHRENRRIAPLYQVAHLTATLCYLEDALAGLVPLYRFADPKDASSPFSMIAAGVAKRLPRRNPREFLLVPQFDARGGLVSLTVRCKSRLTGVVD